MLSEKGIEIRDTIYWIETIILWLACYLLGGSIGILLHGLF